MNHSRHHHIASAAYCFIIETVFYSDVTSIILVIKILSYECIPGSQYVSLPLFFEFFGVFL